MKIVRNSYFKDPEQDILWFNNWAKELESTNGREYERMDVHTSLGKTHIWGLNTKDKTLDTLVIFPGARTTGLFWDFDRGLDFIGLKLRLFLVETNGLPNLSDGHTPDIKTMHYGDWANEVLERLNINSAYIAGASFGGLICAKLCIKAPEKVKAAFLLNPGCLQSFSLLPKNIYYNLLPIISPTRNHISNFLDNAVFHKPYHRLSERSEKLIIDYEEFALTRFKDNTQKPYSMKGELQHVKSDVYLLEGKRDILFPYKKSIQNAKKYMPSLEEIRIFENVGHGIETYNMALNYIGEVIKDRSVKIVKMDLIKPTT